MHNFKNLIKCLKVAPHVHKHKDKRQQLWKTNVVKTLNYQ